MKPITLFTWGYYGWGNHTPELVEAVDAVETSRGFEPPIFVDIRIRRTVRAKGFQGNAVEKLLGPDRHRWMKSLGNKFIQSRTGPGIQSADPTAADELLDLAVDAHKRKQRLLFFCSCQLPRCDGKIACHRTTVAGLVLKAARKRGVPVEIAEWPGGDRLRVPVLSLVLVPRRHFHSPGLAAYLVGAGRRLAVCPECLVLDHGGVQVFHLAHDPGGPLVDAVGQAVAEAGPK